MSELDEIDRLLEKKCYIMDFLPERVLEDSDGQYFDVENYLLNSDKYLQIRDKFENVIFSLMCYFHMKIFWNDSWIDKPDPKMIDDIISGHSNSLNCLFPNEDMLLVYDKDYLYLAIYNPSKDKYRLFEQIACSQGLFWRKAYDNE